MCFVQLFNPSLSLLNNITQNTELFKLFKQTAFLIHRNTYGGLTLHDLQALDSAKKQLVRVLHEPDKKYLTNLIDTLALYGLTDVISNAGMNEVLEKDLFKFISNQSSKDLCEILLEHSPINNGLLLSIAINDKALDLVNDLVTFTKTNTPDRITDVMLEQCNVWHIISNAQDLADNHIHIAFITHDDEAGNFNCYKGLCMAQQYLEDTKVEPVEKVVKERPKKPFKPIFGHGIVSLARKFMVSKPNSNVVIVNDVDVAVKPTRKELKEARRQAELDLKLTVPVQEGVLVEDDDEQEEVINEIEVIGYKGRGFIDIEQGFLFNIT